MGSVPERNQRRQNGPIRIDEPKRSLNEANDPEPEDDVNEKKDVDYGERLDACP